MVKTTSCGYVLIHGTWEYAKHTAPENITGGPSKDSHHRDCRDCGPRHEDGHAHPSCELLHKPSVNCYSENGDGNLQGICQPRWQARSGLAFAQSKDAQWLGSLHAAFHWTAGNSARRLAGLDDGTSVTPLRRNISFNFVLETSFSLVTTSSTK
eukprot:s3023_g1.t1